MILKHWTTLLSRFFAIASLATFSLPSAEAQTEISVNLPKEVREELEYYLSRHDSDDEGYETILRYALRGDTSMSAYMPRGVLKASGFNRWKALKKNGIGAEQQTNGNLIYGWYQNDTLVSGVLFDSLGVYAGRFNRFGQPEGHGTMRYHNGSYYEGHWHHGLRHGFGFQVGNKQMQAGQWHMGKFKGERMNHTSQRIYGIDISRYQHERGRKRFPIDWSHLRIKSLGRRVGIERVSGTVDYPVSFVFIKTTEGISLKNKYFAQDYTAARKARIPVGCYHFFSTKQSASVQATFFLQNARFATGDLPPMLDIEPSDAAIERIGGPEVLFREIKKWLNAVERRTRVRPILYVNQRFVLKFLSQDHDLLYGYPIWVARYGEFKPDARMDFWQVCADGRVNGIRTEVDVNVFNGYQTQWEEFLSNATIREKMQAGE